MAKYISINVKKVNVDFFKLLLSGNSEKVIQEIRENTNEAGYFNFEITERKEKGKYGETHSVKVNEYKPKPKENEDFI